MTRVGFTGTPLGMTLAQVAGVAALLDRWPGAELHHGDCIGADAQAHTLALELGLTVVLHPPALDKARAFCEGAVASRKPRPYLVRNRAIVEETEVLVAAPSGPEVLRGKGGGEWSTVRRARKLERPVIVVWPDGRLDGAIPVDA